jgi:hypothetical protein
MPVGLSPWRISRRPAVCRIVPRRILRALQAGAGAHAHFPAARTAFFFSPPVCSCPRPHPRLQVTGVEAKRCRNHLEQHAVVQEHIRLLRQRAEYQGVPIVFVPENMTGFFHQRMAELMSQTPNAVTFCQHGNEAKPGVFKTAQVTASYVHHTQDMLMTDRIMLEADWVSGTGNAYEGGREGLLAELRTQLSRYGYDEKGHLTGKFQGSGQDDMCIAFMMLVHWMTVVENADRTSPYHKYHYY